MAIALILAASWFAVFLVGHCLVLHFSRPTRRSKTIALLFAAAVLGHAVSCIVATREPGLAGDLAFSSFLNLFLGIVAMSSLYVLYMPFYYTAAASLSVQSLVMLSRASGSRLARATLQNAFASRELVAARLDAMVDSGYLSAVSGQYILTGKGRMIARFFSSLKKLWRLGAGG